jgi:hypothetical protein
MAVSITALVGIIAVLVFVLTTFNSVGGVPFGGESVTGRIVSVRIDGTDTRVCINDSDKHVCGLVPSIPQFTRLRVGECAYLKKQGRVQLERRSCPQNSPST